MTIVTRDDILPSVTEIVAKAFDVPAADLTPDRDLRGVEGVDSVKVLRAVAMLEQHYDVELDDEQIFAVKTLGELTELIERSL